MCVSVRRHPGARAATALFSTLALAALAVPAADAAPVTPAGVCDTAPLSQPFLSWGDSNHYKLAPGGDFEGSSTGWKLTGPAGLVPGSAPAVAGSSSLRLAAGASALSPGTCVTAAYPSLRFFARSDRPGSVTTVSVVYHSLLGDTALGVGAVTPGSSWTPTTAMPTLAALAVLSGGTATFAVRLTQVTGTSQVDDVFIDPHTMH